MKTQLIFSLVFGFAPFLIYAQYGPSALEKAEATIAAFKARNTKFETFFKEAYAYAVFPSVSKGGAGIGGAFGSGTVFEQGRPIGKAKLSQLTMGFQLGGQAYRKVIFFETKDDLQRFKKNKLKFAGGASVVLVKQGASANIAYHEGVAVFSITKAGLMYEAALGGQKLKFKSCKDL